MEGDLLTGAIQFAREIAGKPPLKTRDRAEKLGAAEQNAAIFAAAREAARSSAESLRHSRRLTQSKPPRSYPSIKAVS